MSESAGSGNNIDIVVNDKVSPNVSKKITQIAKDARDGQTAVDGLKAALAQLSSTSGLSKLQSELSRLNSLMAQNSSATSQMAAAQSQTTIAANRAAASQQALAAATAKAQAAQTAAVSAAISASQAQAAGSARVAAASAQASAAVQTGQAQVAAASARAAAAQTGAATAAQRLTTEQARTAAAAAQAAAAGDRAALAALRLQQAQDRAATSTDRSAASLVGWVRAALAAAGITIGVQQIVQAADAYTTMQNKLQQVATSQEQVNRLTGEMFDLANRTRSGVEETTTAFTRFDRAMKGLGASQEETIRLTETINKGLVLSGATTTEAASSLLQLSQAFNKGVLNGDEFRSVAENFPMALDAIAAALRVPTARLQEMASEGKITAAVLRTAFASISEDVDRRFAATTTTVGQSITVLRNNVTQFIGELDKSTGASALLAQGILVLSRNLDIAASAALGLGTAMILYFGPNLVALLGRATQAMVSFTLALARNPIGLIATLIAVAVVSLYQFRDAITVSSDGLVSLGDLVKGVLRVLGEDFATAATAIKTSWETVTTYFNTSTEGWGSTFGAFFSTVLEYAKTGVNLYIGIWVAAFTLITSTWSRFPTLMQGFFQSLANIVASIVESVVNSWQLGLRAITNAVSIVAPETAGRFRDALDSLSLTLPRIDTTPAQQAAGEIRTAIRGALTTDYIGNAGSALTQYMNRVMTAARTISEARRAAAAAAAQPQTALRGTGPNTAGTATDRSAARAAQSRATALAKINEQLDNERDRMFMLQPLREAQQRMDQITEQLLGRRITLTQQEREAIMAKIVANQQALQVQRAFDQIYQDAEKPLNDYNAALEASNRIIAISPQYQDAATRAVTRAREALLNAQDPLRSTNRDIQQQIDLLKLLPQVREVEQRIQQVQNDLLTKGITLTEQQLTQLRERLTLQQQMNNVSQQANQLMAQGPDQRRTATDQATAMRQLLDNQNSGFTRGDAANAMSQGPLAQYMAGTPEQTAAIVQQRQNLYAQIDALRQQDLISEQSAGAMRAQVWADSQKQQLQSASNFFQNLSQLSSSKNKTLAAIGKAASIAQAMINTYTSATAAYAALAGIPYVGPALGAAAAAAAVAAGLANVAAIKSQSTSTGYAQGGYTGDMGRSQVAGVVHGQEFVMNAEATNRIGVANLSALQRGAVGVQQAGPASVGNGVTETASPNVNVPVKVVNVLDPNTLLDAMSSSAGEKVILNTIERNPSLIRRITKG